MANMKSKNRARCYFDKEDSLKSRELHFCCTFQCFFFCFVLLRESVKMCVCLKKRGEKNLPV